MSSQPIIFTDEQIIQGCMQSDRKYQEMLYQKFSGKMYAVCMRYAAEPNSAQDLLQEGFVKVFGNMDKFRGEGSFEGWIRRIFVNTCLEFVRKKAKMYIVQDTENIKLEYHDENGLHKLMQEDLMGVIQSLSTGYRTIFNLYVIEGYSHKEIAEMLNVTEGTSKSQLARARYLLQKKVEILMGIKLPEVKVSIAE